MSVADGVYMSAEWLAHENAVFDIAWVPGNPHLVSTLILMNLLNAYSYGTCTVSDLFINS